MSTSTAPRPSRSVRRVRSAGADAATFFALALALTWSCWVPAGLIARGDLDLSVPPLLLTAIGGFGPLVAAVTLTARRGGGRAVRALLGRLDPRRIPRRWLLAPLLLAGANLTPVAAFLAAGGSLPDRPVVLGALLMLPLHLLIVTLVGGGLDEETGWRGYALPTLLRAAPPAIAHGVLGVIWACWHLPLWLDASSSQAAYPFALYLVTMVAHSVIIGWIFCGSGGSLALAVLAHAVSNATDGLRYQLLADARAELPLQLVLLVAAVAVAAVLVLLTRGRLGTDALPACDRLPADQPGGPALPSPVPVPPVPVRRLPKELP